MRKIVSSHRMVEDGLTLLVDQSEHECARERLEGVLVALRYLHHWKSGAVWNHCPSGLDHLSEQGIDDSHHSVAVANMFRSASLDRMA